MRATIHRGSILRISPGMWGKIGPIPPAMERMIDPTDPRTPTLTVRDESVIVSVPSDDPRVRPVLDSLVAANRSALAGARWLIVDLRGNEGGGARTTDALLPFLVDRDASLRASGLEDAVMLSSPDQIWYASRAFGPPDGEFVTRLVEALERAPGDLVPLLDPSEPVGPSPAIEPVYGPERAAILTDRGTVSAAEVLVREAGRSDRTIVIGSPTAGALDYQSTYIVRFHDDEDAWLLGYPTIAAHGDLPEGGIRGRGIPPEVPVDWDTIPDPFAFAEQVLRTADRGPGS